MIHSPALLVLLAVLAVARLTTLVVDDYVTEPVRAWADRRRGPRLSYLLGCPWCVSIWLGAAVAAATYAWPHRWWVQVPLIALAASHVTGLLAAVRNRIEGD